MGWMLLRSNQDAKAGRVRWDGGWMMVLELGSPCVSPMAA